MNRRTSTALGMLGLAAFAYLVGLWAINEFHVKDDRPADLKLEYILESRLSGAGDSRLSRKFVRDLRPGRDASVLAILRMLGLEASGEPGPAAKGADTLPLADLLAFRAGKLAKEDLAARALAADPDSARFLVPLYWGYADAGLLRESRGDSLLRSRLKALGKGLHRHDLPFQAAEVFRTCLRIQGEGQEDPELEAWLGSALAKRALFVESSLAKIKMVKEGVQLLDKAAYDHPDFGVVRYIRANTYSALPAVFRKSPMLRSDIQYLIERRESGKAIKIWGAGGHVLEAPVNEGQLRQILEKSSTLFSEDAPFRSRMETALQQLEK